MCICIGQRDKHLLDVPGHLESGWNVESPPKERVLGDVKFCTSVASGSVPDKVSGAGWGDSLGHSWMMIPNRRRELGIQVNILARGHVLEIAKHSVMERSGRVYLSGVGLVSTILRYAFLSRQKTFQNFR